MSKEKETVELKDEELEKVAGGSSNTTGNCGISTFPNLCNQYDSAKDQCKGCPGKPLTAESPAGYTAVEIHKFQ